MEEGEELCVLLRTSHPAAVATIERLAACELAAVVQDVPNAIVRLTSGGTYRVDVLVRPADLERARAELANWEADAGPRVDSLAREVQRGLLLASAPALALSAGLLLARSDSFTGWFGVIALLATGVCAWAIVSRRGAAR